MQIICRKKVRIVEYKYVKNEVTKELVSIEQRSLTISPSFLSQSAPDWIKQEDHFKMLVDDGTIQEIVVLSKRKTEKEIPTDAPIAATGWGASPQGMTLGKK